MHNFLILSNSELDPLSYGQRNITRIIIPGAGLDHSVMEKYFLSIIWLDESVSFVRVEPIYCASGADFALRSCIRNRFDMHNFLILSNSELDPLSYGQRNITRIIIPGAGLDHSVMEKYFLSIIWLDESVSFVRVVPIYCA